MTQSGSLHRPDTNSDEFKIRRFAQNACSNNVELGNQCVVCCEAKHDIGRSATADEILVSFPGRSKFKVHKVMPKRGGEMWH
jgi:hypothetical protein